MPDGARPAGADRTLYALHPIPLSDVKAVRKHAPSWGTQHVVLVLNNGLTLPPLYFAHGGIKALFSALKEVQLSAALDAVPAPSRTALISCDAECLAYFDTFHRVQEWSVRFASA